jgi:hypothetical protein
MDDRSGKPKAAEAALAEVSEILDEKRAAMTANLLRILRRERGRAAPDAFAEFAEGMTMIFSELDATMGDWAHECVRREQEMHEARS